MAERPCRTLPPLRPRRLPPEWVAQHIDWEGWEARLATHGYVIDRPRHQPHPRYAEIIYPLDYGELPGTLGTDGEPVDVFVGTAPEALGLVGLLLTRDHVKRDREVKLLYRCTPQEVYLAHGFISFDRRLLESTLVMRWPMHTLWGRTQDTDAA